jgi:hypothetical protein
MDQRIPSVLAIVALAVTVAVPLSLARFVDVASSSATYSADVLTPPTGLSAFGGTGGIRLRWAATADAYASGYDVLRSSASGSGFSQVATVTPASAATILDVPSTGTWFYVLRSAFQNWTSVPSAEVSGTRPAVPALVGCTAGSAAAATGGNGDGYETTPDNACAAGGGSAVDANTGTILRSSACANTANDRHVFWGYDFALPSSVTSIDGVVVQASASMTGIGIDDAMCIELSWDAGSSWSAPIRVTLPDNTLRTYTFGSATTTWGHTWTASQLRTSTFRIRVTDATATVVRSYQLDHLAVQLYLTP